MNKIEIIREHIANRTPLYHKRFSLVSDILLNTEAFDHKTINLIKRYKDYISLNIELLGVNGYIIDKLGRLGITEFDDNKDLMIKIDTLPANTYIEHVKKILYQDFHTETLINKDIDTIGDIKDSINSLKEILTNYNKNDKINQLLPILNERNNERSLKIIKDTYRTLPIGFILSNIKSRYNGNIDSQAHRIPKILDLGCGVGNMIQDIQEELPFADTYAIDKDNTFHPRPEKKDSKKTQFIQYDLEEGLPHEIANEKFDFIHSGYALQYVAYFPNLLPIYYNLLEEKGNAIIVLGPIDAIDQNRIKALKQSNKDNRTIRIEKKDDIYIALITKQNDQNTINIPPYKAERGHDIRKGNEFGKQIYCITSVA